MDNAPLERELVELERLMTASGVPQPFGLPPGPAQRAHFVRLRVRFQPQIPLPVDSITDIEIPRDGDPLPARVIRPRGQVRPVPTVVYLHGGGWAIGDLDTHEGHARRIANRVGAVVVNVDYRLAPEDPFPTGHDDAITALDWVTAHVADLGGDPGKVAVAGDSAGGNLALGAALSAADAGSTSPGSSCCTRSPTSPSPPATTSPTGTSGTAASSSSPTRASLRHSLHISVMSRRS